MSYGGNLWGGHRRERNSHNGARAVSTEGKRARTVFNNDMVAHVWAQQNQDFGRSANGNFYFRGATIYSYGGHFPIATFTGLEHDGRAVVLFTCAGYSVSTSQHVSNTRGALRGLPVIVLDVPDLKKWQDAQPRAWELEGDTEEATERRGRVEKRLADLHSETLARFTRSIAQYERWAGDSKDSDYIKRATEERREAEIYRAVFKVRQRLPRDCRAHVAALEARAEKERLQAKYDRARQAASKLDGRNPLASLTDTAALELPSVDKVDSWQIRNTLNTLSNASRQAHKTRYWLIKGKCGAEHKARVSKLIKQLKTTTAAWEGLRVAFEAKSERDSTLRTIEAIRAHIAGNPTPQDVDRLRNLHWTQGCIVEATAGNLIAAIDKLDGDHSDCKVWIWRRVSLRHAVSEMRGAYHPIPEWVYRNRRNADTRTREEKAAAWLRGERVDGFQSVSPTLVRRNGDKLETSRHASVPFREAVAVFLKAQDCRAKGKAWHRNGERMQAGSFDLESIAPNGDIRIGCHVISYPEMQRLACEQIPQAVKPRFPLPAIRNV